MWQKLFLAPWSLPEAPCLPREYSSTSPGPSTCISALWDCRNKWIWHRSRSQWSYRNDSPRLDTIRTWTGPVSCIVPVLCSFSWRVIVSMVDWTRNHWSNRYSNDVAGVVDACNHVAFEHERSARLVGRFPLQCLFDRLKPTKRVRNSLRIASIYRYSKAVIDPRWPIDPKERVGDVYRNREA